MCGGQAKGCREEDLHSGGGVGWIVPNEINIRHEAFVFDEFKEVLISVDDISSFGVPERRVRFGIDGGSRGGGVSK